MKIEKFRSKKKSKNRKISDFFRSKIFDFHMIFNENIGNFSDPKNRKFLGPIFFGRQIFKLV